MNQDVLNKIIAAKREGSYSLILEDMGIKELPREIGLLRNLKHLYLKNNQLSSLPDELVNLESLARLYLDGNQFTILPRVVCKLRNLTWLDLTKNQLSSLPDELANLEFLDALYLDGNQFTILPRVVCKLRNLTWLRLDKNQLSSLPDELVNLDNLNYFYIEQAQLKLSADQTLFLEAVKIRKKIEDIVYYSSFHFFEKDDTEISIEKVAALRSVYKDSQTRESLPQRLEQIVPIIRTIIKITRSVVRSWETIRRFSIKQLQLINDELDKILRDSHDFNVFFHRHMRSLRELEDRDLQLLASHKTESGLYVWEHTLEMVCRFAIDMPSAMNKIPISQDRWVQSQILAYQQDKLAPVRMALKPDTDYTIRVFIGPEEREVFKTDTPFPEHELPQDKINKLTVIFCEAFQKESRAPAPKPQTGVINLPATGKSTSCDFTFNTGHKTSIDARITVLFRNRVLQTIQLMAPVSEQTAQDTILTITLETVCVEDFAHLDVEKDFDAALVVNHTEEGVPSITAKMDSSVGIAMLPDMTNFIKNTGALISQYTKLIKPAAGLPDEQMRKLLVDLAAHGNLLWETICDDLPDSLSNAGRIQIIEAAPGNLFPAKLLYRWPAPCLTAVICPYAIAGLKKEELSINPLQNGCHKNCPGEIRERKKVVCPFAFWGNGAVIERHSRGTMQPLPAGTACQIGPAATEAVQRPRQISSALVGLSCKVDGKRKKTPKPSDLVMAGITNLGIGLNRIFNMTDWETVVKEKSPSLFVLLVHTFSDKTNMSYMQIEDAVSIRPADIEEYHLSDHITNPGPLVFLVGCSTQLAEFSFQGFVPRFIRKGASVVVSTLSVVRGRYAAPATALLLETIHNELRKKGKISFGNILLNAKRRLLANNEPISLCLIANGNMDISLSL